MSYSRLASNICCKNKSIFSLLINNNSKFINQIHLNSIQYRSIFSTPRLDNAWMDKIKGVFTGKKADSPPSADSLTLLRFAEEMKNARGAGNLKKFIMGSGASETTYANAIEKQEAIIRYLGGFDNTGENILASHKQEAAKRCSCTIAEVENALAKYRWAKEAQKMIEKLKEEGKPMPKNLSEVQKLMGKTPMDMARSDLPKSGKISRNALCTCGSEKKYKRCCGKGKFI